MRPIAGEDAVGDRYRHRLDARSRTAIDDVHAGALLARQRGDGHVDRSREVVQELRISDTQLLSRILDVHANPGTLPRHAVPDDNRVERKAVLGKDGTAGVHRAVHRIGERQAGDRHEIVGTVDRRTCGIGDEYREDAARSVAVDRDLVRSRTGDGHRARDLELPARQRDRSGQPWGKGDRGRPRGLVRLHDGVTQAAESAVVQFGDRVRRDR